MGLDDYFNKTSLEVLGFLPCVPIKTEGLTLREDDKYLIDNLAQARDIGLQTNKLWPPGDGQVRGQAGRAWPPPAVTPKEFIATLAKLWDEADAWADAGSPNPQRFVDFGGRRPHGWWPPRSPPGDTHFPSS